MMRKAWGWTKLCLFALGLVVAMPPTWAQTKTPEDEYKDLIRVSQDIEPLGEHPFGANISLYDGSLSFEQTDVSLAGNGPLLKLVRTYKLQGRDQFVSRPHASAFGDWELDLPRIATMTANQNNVTGWMVQSSGDVQRCTDFGKPPIVAAPAGDAGRADWIPATWWHGYHLIIPGQGGQDLLVNLDADAVMYPAVTKQHWRISCLDSTANGMPGEGFVAHAPDGTSYRFDELVYRWAPTLTRPIGSGPMTKREEPSAFPFANRHLLARALGWLTGSAPAHALPDHDFLARREAWMLVTRIEDRFGNWLKFNYDDDGHLTDILASDGRELTVEYVSGTGLIQRVTLQPSAGTPREWEYAYTGSSPYQQLTSVTLPDGHKWQFDLDAFNTEASLRGTTGSCQAVGVPSLLDSQWTGTITHPSGLVGSFTVKPVKHGRSYVVRECRGVTNGSPQDAGSYAVRPSAWYSLTMTQRTFAGAGIGDGAESWEYSYSLPNDSWMYECSGGCASTVWTKVLNPDGSSVKYTFSNRYDSTESQLLNTEHYSGDAAGLLRKVVNFYAATDAGPWPLHAGSNPQERINEAQTTQYMPLAKRVIHQDGDTYTWQAEAFDVYTHVTKTKRFNSIGQSSIEEATTYKNDTSLWVLGLPLTHTNLTTGDVVDAYVYNTKDLITDRSHFGQPVMSYTWNSAGQLLSFTDANTNTTTLGNYKRGIPQTITYPDATSQHLTVDAFGQITSITNQTGHTTQYAYDAVGRLTRITYPGSGMWYPKVFQYQYVTGAERGLAGGHWRRTVSQGDAYHVTRYDALLRPVLTDTFIGSDSGSHISARTAYNWKGLTVFQSWPVAGSPALSSITAGTTTTYDALGRITAISQPSELGTLTTTTTYLGGARKQVTDPEGHVTTTSYQVFDQPSYKAVTQVQAPEGIVQSITRDIYGAPRTITQSGPDGLGGITKHLYYNPEHRLCRTQEPETGSTLMGYDAVGNLLWSAEGLTVTGDGCGSQPASHIARTYDAMNRLTAVKYLDGQGNIIASTTTTYDNLGQVETTKSDTVSDSVQWAYDYDNRGHLTSETLVMNGLASPWPIHYAYDHYGHVSALTYPDGKRISYAPDALGRATKAGVYAIGASYFPDGTLKHFTYGGGQNDYLAQRNARHLLGNLTVGSPGTGPIVYSQDMVYDKDANIISMMDLTLGGERTKTLSYDALNRLTEAKASNLWGTITYTYDALNNIRSLTRNGVDPKTYHYANNHLTSITSGDTSLHSFAYDPQGNMTQKDSQVRVFSMGHRLLQIPGIATYAYDAAGRRVKATDAGGNTTYYAYNRAGHLMYQWNDATQISTRYVYLGKKLIAEVKRTSDAPVLNAPGVSIDHNPNDGSFTVSWTATNGTSYTLQEQVNDGTWNTIYSGATASKALSGKPGGRYRYRVRTCDGDCSDWGYSVVVGVTPAKPAISVPDGIQNDRYTVSWNRPVSATGFDVQEQADGGTWQTIADDTTATSISLPGDRDGTYTYRVRASNTYGTRGWVTSNTVTVLLPPTTAPSLSVPGSNSTGDYTVSWNSVVGADRYHLQQQINGGSWSKTYDVASTSKALSGQVNGTYGYQVQACNAGGCGPWSATQSITVLHLPAEPGSIDVPATSSGSVVVDWPAVATATSYTLQHRKDSGSWSNAYSGSATSRTVTETSTGSYAYQVRACNNSGCSNYRTSTAVEVTIAPDTSPSLSAPGISDTGSYTISWGSVSGASSYTLQQRTNESSWSEAYDGASRSKAFSGKANGVDYGYRVRACNAGGCGPWSAVQTVSIAIPPAEPTGVYANDVHINPKKEQLVIVWNAVSGASSYRIKNLRTGQLFSRSVTSITVYDGEPPAPVDDYAVRSCNAYACSDWVNADRRNVYPAPTTAPSLSAPSSDGNGSYTVSWGSVYQASRYILQQQVNGGSWHTQYDGTNRSQAESGQSNGTYGYRVRACTSGGCGPWSGTANVTVLHPPGIPGSIDVPSTSDESVPVDWPASSTATSYTLQHRKGSGSWSNAYSGSATSRTVTETSTGSYTYRVRACNSGGCSSYRSSSAVAVTVPPASAPSLSVPSSDSNGSYTVSWGSVSGASSYTLQQQVNGGSWSTQYSGSNRSKAYSGKTNGADYGYRVRACNAGGCGPWSAAQTVSIAIPPPKPTGVYANHVYINPKLEQLTIVWNAVSGASSYRIKNLRTGHVDSRSVTSMTVYYGEPPAPLDSYAVRACNAYACSAWVTATLRVVDLAPGVAPSLSAPAGDSNGSYTVSWGAVYRADRYTLQQQTNGGSWSTVYDSSGRSKGFSGKADGSYGYRVRACNSGGCGPWSATRTVVVAKPPATPTGLDAYVSGPSYRPVVNVSWNAVAHATAYHLEQTLPGQSPQVLNMGTATSTSSLQMVSGQITYRVRACNAAGCSPWSGYESVWVMAGGMLTAPVTSSSTAVSTDDATTEQGGQ